jgi:hypothetical protein
VVLVVAHQLQPCEGKEGVQWICASLPWTPFAKSACLFLAAQYKVDRRTCVQPMLERNHFCWNGSIMLTACQNIQRSANLCSARHHESIANT